MKIKIIYWSGTGNTQMMAEAIKSGAETVSKKVELVEVDNANVDMVKEADVVFLGCPAMGAEVLEESSFQPFFDEIKGSLKGKKVGLFGSYDWGDGEWMRSWESEVKGAGATLIAEGLIANLTPDDDVLDKCKSFGKKVK